MIERLPPLPHDATGKDPETRKLAVDIWKKVVDVQQHFNDIELRIRNMAVTTLVGTLGAAGYFLKENHFLLAAGVAGLGCVGWCAFWAMDEFWYHRFLKAAAIHGAHIEDRWKAHLPELGLANAISVESPVKLRLPQRVAPLFLKAGRIHSSEKIRLFYVVGAGLISIVVVVALGSQMWEWSSPIVRRRLAVSSVEVPPMRTIEARPVFLFFSVPPLSPSVSARRPPRAIDTGARRTPR